MMSLEDKSITIIKNFGRKLLISDTFPIFSSYIAVTSFFHCKSIIIPRSHQCGEANEYYKDVTAILDKHLWRSDSEEINTNTKIEKTSSNNKMQMDFLDKMCRKQHTPKKF